MNGALVLLLISFFTTACATGPSLAGAETPVTGFAHIDIALEQVEREPLVRQIAVYHNSAIALARVGSPVAADLARRMEDAVTAIAVNDVETLVELASLWNSLAVLDEAYIPGSHRVLRRVLELRPRELTARESGELHVRLLASQLANPDSEEATTRRILDSLYLITDDSVRAQYLVAAAEIIRDTQDRLNLNPVVQQGIAIVPALEDATDAAILSMRLADLSASLDRPRDVRALREAAVRNAEGGLLIQPPRITELQRLVEIAYHQGDHVGAEIILQNVAPVSARALGYGFLARQMLLHGGVEDGQDMYRQALTIAMAIDDPTTRGRTVSTLIFDRLLHDELWSPVNAIADLLGTTPVATFDREDRIFVLGNLFAGYHARDEEQQIVRLRGLIRSADELSFIRITAAESLVRAERLRAAEIPLRQLERMPQPEPGSRETPALRVALLWLALGDPDRAVIAATEADAGEQAELFSGIPADFSFNPVARDVLERLREG